MKQAILRISVEQWHAKGMYNYSRFELRKLLDLPSECKVIGWSEHALFLTNQIAVKIEDPCFIDTPEGKPLPEVTANYVDGEFSHWNGPAVKKELGGWKIPANEKSLITALLYGMEMRAEKELRIDWPKGELKNLKGSAVHDKDKKCVCSLSVLTTSGCQCGGK